MDHFLFAKNPLKKYASTGIQGYIIDTVKGTWLKLEVCHQPGKPDQHLLTMIAGTGDNKEDRQSAHRASRWYNAILIARKVEEADIVVELPHYTGNEPAPEKRYDYQQVSDVTDKAEEELPKTSSPSELYQPDGLAPVVSLGKKLTDSQ